MSDFNLVDPKGWEYDLQSVYSAYIGHFQLHNISWYERSWGHLFESFEEFLAFSWPVITVTDERTGRAHIVTRMTSIGAFLKMIKTRFGETLPVVDHMLKVAPFEMSSRHLKTVSDWASYKKLHATLPAAVLAAYKARVRSGDHNAIQELWESRDKTYLAIDFEWSERNNLSCLEWGYATVRCGVLNGLGRWPPAPDANYRKGHYVVSEYADKVHNKLCPTFPWQYAFGESQTVPKAKLPQIIKAVISSLLSPESETLSNNLVLVGHGLSGDLARLEDMKIKLPHNVLIIDTVLLEKSLFAAGQRGPMLDSKGNARIAGSSLSLENLLRSLNIDIPCQLHNSGNDAFMTLFALQKLLDPDNTALPTPILRNIRSSPAIMSVPRMYAGYASVPASLSIPPGRLPASQTSSGDLPPVRRGLSPAPVNRIVSSSGISPKEKPKRGMPGNSQVISPKSMTLKHT